MEQNQKERNLNTESLNEIRNAKLRSKIIWVLAGMCEEELQNVVELLEKLPKKLS